MLTNKKSIILLFALLTMQIVSSQTQSNSPYTRFGYGGLANICPTELKGMGGVSIANHSKQIINSLNPASYASVDSMTFMFDIGASFKMSRFSDKINSNKTTNANLNYVRFRFPVAKWLAFSGGLEPYSFVGYKYHQTDSISIPPPISKTKYFMKSFNGQGGLSQAYAGASLKLFNHVALGVNAYYLFGELNNNRALSFFDPNYKTSIFENSIKANDFRLRYGIQAFHNFSKKHSIIVGAVLEPKHKINGDFSSKLNSQEILSNKDFELPQTLGVGVNYTFNNKLTIGADYEHRNWKETTYFGKKDTLVSTNKLALGMQYIPNPRGRRYIDHIQYRIGFNTNNQYYKVLNNNSAQDYTFSLGLGLPTRTGKSIMNIAIEYGRMGQTSILREDFLRISFSASINERWFFKPKI